ncbi:putative catalytic subunit of DNA polymerase zeta UPR-1 [Testicularia cyperi]|uniref:DNA polymerase n=1 Tax=Testicularia cyperi TaxID=1882483 RepID=A0A317XJT3_9BASI|nr:putative catalytic subunit of DNA polymerase zeta UPR-1 [Testicularia cyperi]
MSRPARHAASQETTSAPLHHQRASSTSPSSGEAKASSTAENLPKLPSATSHTPASPPDPFFRIRLINIDHVLTTPGPLDRTVCAFNAEGSPLRKVPTLRIFGATPAGQRVCLHVHNVYPYCYIQYKGSLNPEHVLRYIHRLGRELNTAMAVSLRRNPDDPNTNQFIAAIHLCKGINFYGYHVGYSYFLKISFIDPAHNYRLAAILESGGVMKTVFQPFEIHIRYQLQFMLDYNIFGCDFIDLDDVRFRLPVPEGDDIATDASSPLEFRDKRWNRNSIPYTNLQSEGVHRGTHCEIEVDASAPWIINRRKLHARNLHGEFDEHLRTPDVDTKLVPSLRGLWEDERARRVASGLPPSIPTDDPTRDPRKYATGESPAWMSEDRMRLLLQKRLLDDKQQTLERERRPNHFTDRTGLDQYIMTTFEAVECFHPYQEEDSAADPYTQRSGPAASTKLYDLQHSMTQQNSQSSSSQHVYDDSNAAVEKEKGEMDDDNGSIDTDFFQSQDFAARLRQAETADAVANEDLASDEEKDEHGQHIQEAAAVNGMTDANEGLDGRAWKRTDSAASSASGASLFSRSPSTTPRKRQKFEVLDPADTPTGSPSSAKRSQDSYTSNMKKWQESKDQHQRTTSNNSDSTTTSRAGGRVRFASSSTVLSTSQPDSATVGQPSTTSAETVSDPASNQQPRRRFVTFHEPAPSLRAVTETFPLFNVVRQIHRDPFYSDPSDVPERAREYAGRMFKFQSDSLSYLKPFLHWHAVAASAADASVADGGGRIPRARYWQFGPPPPTVLETRAWQKREHITEQQRSKRRRARMLSQIERLSQANEYGFKVSQHQPTSLVPREKQHMTILAMEVLCTTRGSLHPDPAKDPVQAIVYCFQNEDEQLQDTGSRPDLRTGLIMIQDCSSGQDEGGARLAGAGAAVRADRLGLSHLAIETVDNELDLYNALVDLVRAFDPEILVGWEIHSSSWGYVIERAAKEYEFDLVPELGRAIVHNTGRAGGKSDNYAYTQSSALRITGRHVLNLWRLMKGELALNLYTLENVAYHLLHKRVPRFSHHTITQWYSSPRPADVRKALRYYIDTVELVLEVIAESEFVFRTAEFARIYGIDFFSVISRGSQFKVESIMLRIAKPENFVLISPNRSQVGQQNAAECLPLIMEPQSAFYKGPLVVLDFQSLYPSIMIAYNLCYSTCLGRIASFKGTGKFGVTEYSPPKGLLSLLHDQVNISSNGLLFVKPSVRKSLLAKMLSEILDTRVMVKSSMKATRADRAFQRIQNARQLSLKLLANVTYGYTSASFSGRMPCVEIADAIVQTGRETLEKAMDLINGTPEWGAQVVYGDTDSLFIYLPGRTKEEAFRLGNEIADTVTSLNPRPVKLKFEKVYLPSVLMAKKRYVGFKYETLEEREPSFEAKGIETVRRDFHPAIQRMLEASIRILFRSRDLSAVKKYLQRQWRKILEGRVSPQDFVFAKEVRLGSYSDKVAPPPGAAVASRRMLSDPRSEPQYGERVPYIISQGEPKAKLNAQAVSPAAFLKNPRLQINALYYIERTIIPPLARVFNLLGADVEAWFAEIPKPNNVYWNKRPAETQLRSLLESLQAQQQQQQQEDQEQDQEQEQEQEQVRTEGNSISINGNGDPDFKSKSRLGAPGGGSANLNAHYTTSTCIICQRDRTLSLICPDCLGSPGASLWRLSSRLSRLQTQQGALSRICATCSRADVVADTPCISLDCPYTFAKARLEVELDDTAVVHDVFGMLAQDRDAQRRIMLDACSDYLDPSRAASDF